MNNLNLSSDASTRKAPGFYVYLVAVVAAVGGFIYGFDMVIMSGAIIFLKKHFALNANLVGFAMGSMTLGCIAGLVIGGRLCDWIGRKLTLIFAALLFAISAIGTAVVDFLYVDR